jgi:predicted membrane protein (TIGR00267 family)
MENCPSLRRFFINTLFDSTFTLLGVIVGSAFVADPELNVILGTMITISLGLGISSGSSVYQAESLEQELQVQRLEKAMLKSLDGTNVTKSAKKSTMITALVNLLTPFFTCFLYSIPLLIALTGVIDVRTGAISSIAVALITLMITGIVMNKNGKGNPIVKGIKMAGLGGITFLLGYVVQLLL